MANYAIINIATGLVENVSVWDGIEPWSPADGYIAVQTDIAGPGWSYIDGVFIPPPIVPPTDAEIEATNRDLLKNNNQLAAAQKSALTNRIGTIQDAIDMEMVTPEELVELPERQDQLVEWKRYAILLGRVTLQEGWALTVEWPEQPTEGMDLSISAKP